LSQKKEELGFIIMNTKQTLKLDAETIIWLADQSFARPFTLKQEHTITRCEEVEGAYEIQFGEIVQLLCYLNEKDANNNIKRVAHDKLEKNLDAFNEFKEHQRKEFDDFFYQYSEAFKANNELIKTIDNQDKCKFVVNYSNFNKFSKKHLTLETAVKEAYYAGWSHLAIPLSIFEGDKEIWNKETSKLNLEELLDVIQSKDGDYES
jgi:hypothetical protein